MQEIIKQQDTIKTKDTTNNMTTGNPMGLIVRFTLPLLLGNLFQQMYNLIDSIIVGQTLGLDALSAVGASASITFLILGFVLGTCAGFAIPVAQAFGAGKESDMRKYVYNSGILVAICAVILTVLTCLMCRNILTWMGTPDRILDDAVAYLFVIFLGLPFTFLYNILAGVIRSLGDSKTPFYFLILSTILNIIGDLGFIMVLHMGVRGASLATILAQAISGIGCLIYMKKRFAILKMCKEERRFDQKKANYLMKIGLPMGLQFSITAIGSIMLQAAINGLGITAVGAYAAAMKIKMFIMCPFEAIGSTMATYAGQNLGAGKLDRIRTGLKDSVLLGVGYGILAGVILHLGGEAMTRLFVTGDNAKVIHMSGQYLSSIGTFYFVLAVLIILRNTIQGLGYSAPVFFSGVFELIARTAMSLFVIPVFGYTAACYTDVTAWVLAACFLVSLLGYVMKQLKGRLQV